MLPKEFRHFHPKNLYRGYLEEKQAQREEKARKEGGIGNAVKAKIAAKRTALLIKIAPYLGIAILVVVVVTVIGGVLGGIEAGVRGALSSESSEIYGAEEDMTDDELAEMEEFRNDPAIREFVDESSIAQCVKSMQASTTEILPSLRELPKGTDIDFAATWGAYNASFRDIPEAEPTENMPAEGSEPAQGEPPPMEGTPAENPPETAPSEPAEEPDDKLSLEEFTAIYLVASDQGMDRVDILTTMRDELPDDSATLLLALSDYALGIHGNDDIDLSEVSMTINELCGQSI